MVEKIVSIADILSGHVAKETSIRGWLYRKRESGKVLFLVVRDATNIIQVLVEKDKVSPVEFEAAKKALVESSLIVTGTVKKDSRAPGGYELHATSLTIVGWAEIFPIKEHQSEELILDNRHLWVRSRELTAVTKVKATVLEAAREWFSANGWWETTPPILTPCAGEGGATAFEIKYFDQPAYLAQTAQLYLEALIFSLEKVWSLTPSFRAEKSRTPRHLTEFWHLEGEAAWVDNEENMRIHEELVSYIVQKVASRRKDELKLLKREPKELASIEPPFKRLTYDEAVKLLNRRGLNFKYGDDFGAVEERELTIEETKPIFVKNYPKSAKGAFYMKENPDDPSTVLCSDMLAPEGYGEVIGASERETNNEILIARLKAQNAKIENYQWYLELRKFGSVPHSGFGLGVERIVRWLCKLDHIRDAIPFPRTVTRVYP